MHRFVAGNSGGDKTTFIKSITKELKEDKRFKEGEAFLQGLSVEELRTLEKKAKDMGLSERLLIENAASNLFQIIHSLGLGRRGAVIAGRGNNGADVLSCARKLLNRGYDLEIILINDREVNEEVKFQRDILEKINKMHFLREEKDLVKLKSIFKGKNFILEGILGIGIKGEPQAFLGEIIDCLNRSKKTIISCDIPSGLSPEEGCLWSHVVRATHTITFIAPKKGFFINHGLDFCGKIHLADIGISREALEKIN